MSWSSYRDPKHLSLYDDLLAIGAQIDNHYSDLYVKASPDVYAVIRKHKPAGVNSFISQIDGQRWIEVPFAYVPYWQAKQRKA